MSDSMMLGNVPMELVYAIPQDILDLADKLSNWMTEHGYKDWQLRGCADRRLVLNLLDKLVEAEKYQRALESIADLDKLNGLMDPHNTVNPEAEDHRYDGWSIEDTVCKDCSDKDTCKYAGDPYCSDTCLADK